MGEDKKVHEIPSSYKLTGHSQRQSRLNHIWSVVWGSDLENLQTGVPGPHAQLVYIAARSFKTK